MTNHSEILYAEDNEALRKAAKTILEQRYDGPIQISTARDGKEAIDKLEQSYDAFITDFEMPYKDGAEFIKYARDNSYNQPAIVFTGNPWARIEDRLQGFEGVEYRQKRGKKPYLELAKTLKGLI